MFLKHHNKMGTYCIIISFVIAILAVLGSVWFTASLMSSFSSLFCFWEFFVSQDPSPTETMANFITNQRIYSLDGKEDPKLGMTVGFGSLPIEHMHSYSQAACATADSMGALRDGVRLQFSKIPEDVLDDVSRMAFVDGLNENRNYFYQTVSSPKGGTIHAYIVYYHTSNKENDKHVVVPSNSSPSADSQASSCIVISGTEIKPGVVNVAYETQERTVTVAQERRCTWYGSCTYHPVREKQVFRFPVFEYAQMTYEEQVKLRHRMINDAVDSAKAQLAMYAPKVLKTITNANKGIGVFSSEEGEQEFVSSWNKFV